MANISPAKINLDESLNTIKFAERARHVNKIQKNDFFVNFKKKDLISSKT